MGSCARGGNVAAMSNWKRSERVGFTTIVGAAVALVLLSLWGLSAHAETCGDLPCERPVQLTEDEQIERDQLERRVRGVSREVAEEVRELPTLTRSAALYVLQMPRPIYPLEGEYQRPETDDQEDRRRILIVRSVVEEAAIHPGFDPEDAVALVLATMNGESGHYEYRVHAGLATHFGTQDGGRAKCLAQIRTWRNNTLLRPGAHAELVGTDYESTRRCAKAALDYYWHHATRCEVRQRRGREPWSRAWDRGRMTVAEAMTLLRAYARGSCVSEDRRDQVPIPAKGEAPKKPGPLQLKLETWTRMVRAFEAGRS